MEHRVERRVVGDQVEDLLPGLLLLGLVLGFGGRVDHVRRLLRRGRIPAVTVDRPGLAVVEPAQQQVDVRPEHGRVTRGGQDPEVVRGDDVAVDGRRRAGALRGVDPDGLPLLDEQRRGVLDECGVGRVQLERQILHAGLGQQALGLVRIVTVDRVRLLVAGVPLVQVTGCRRTEALQRGLDNLVLVQGVVQRLADPLVVERFGAAVEHQKEQVERLDLVDGELLGRLDPGHVQIRDRFNRLGPAAGQIGDAGGRVRGGVPGHRGDQGGPGTVVGGIGRELQQVGRGTVQLERAAADRCGVESLVPRRRLGLGDDLDHRDPLREQAERVLQRELGRGLVLGGDLVDERDEPGHQRLVGRVGGPGERPGHVVGGDIAAVGELCPVPQADSPGQAVVAGLGLFLGQGQVRLSGDRIQIDERFEDVLVRGRRHRAGGVHRVEPARQREGHGGLDGSPGGAPATCATRCRGSVGGGPTGGRLARIDLVRAGRTAAGGQRRGQRGRGAQRPGVPEEGPAADSGESGRVEKGLVRWVHSALLIRSHGEGLRMRGMSRRPRPSQHHRWDVLRPSTHVVKCPELYRPCSDATTGERTGGMNGDGKLPSAEEPARAHRVGPRMRVKTTRSELLQEQIKQLILTRGMSAGDPLPTELELVDELGVGRNSLREALKALQAVGIVDIRHGFGTYVGRMSLEGLVDELTFRSRITLDNGNQGLADVVEIRQVLECGLVQRLMELHPDADLSEVDAVVREMESVAATGEVPLDADRQFHELLYRPLANPLIGPLLGAFFDVYRQVEDMLGPSTESPQDTARKHRAIQRAVRAGDRAGAVAAMTRHFDGVRHRIRRS